MAGMQDLVGRKVKITLDDGLIVNGFLHSYGANDGKLSLEKVECIENGSRKKLVGLQHYFAEEITDIVVTEEVFKNKRNKLEATDSKSHGGRSLMGKKQEPVHLSRLQNINYPSLVLKTNKHNELLTSSGNESGSSGSEQEVLPQSDEYTIISKLSSTFYEAISYIRKYQVIAVSTEGVMIGRAGKLCWLQIAVPDQVFLFDVLSIGRACFDEGVKGLLEDEDILKVFHDCRMISDILHHQYNIKLVNVFDTQVANVFVYRLKHHQDWPRYVEGLSSCLVQHLNLSVEDVNWSVVREAKREEDEMVWMQRPPQRHLVEAAVKNVKHLLELRTVLMEKMMEEFVAGVNIYLMHVRDANDSDACRYQTSPHLLPYAFQDLRAFMSSYSRNSFINYNRAKDPNGFRDNSYGISQPNIYFSKDSVWHAGLKKSEKNTVNSSSDTVHTQPASENGLIVAEPAQPNTETSVSNLSMGTEKVTIPSHRNLLSKGEIEAINMTVEKFKLPEDSQTSRSQSTGVTLTETFDLENQGQDRSLESSDQEMTGGKLMRALVYEQDKSGFECNSGIDSFSIIPAGRMCNEKRKKKKPQFLTSHSTTTSNYHSSSSVNGYCTNPQSPPQDRLEQVIPGGDVVTRSPRRHVGLALQERALLENIEQQSASQVQVDLRKDRTPKSDNDNPPERTRGQRGQICNVLNMQLQGKKTSAENYQSEPEFRSEPKYSMRGISQQHSVDQNVRDKVFNESHGIHSQQNEMLHNQSIPRANKLEILMKKLKQKKS